MFSKYDALGRVVITGLYSSVSERPALETTVAAQTNLFEMRSSDEVGYNSNAFPQSIAYYHSTRYYDDYSFPGASSYSYADSSGTGGLLTGSRITVLGTGDMLLSVNYYDEEGRISKVYKQHYQSGVVDVGNYDEVSNSYNFEGILTASVRVHHNVSSGNTTIASRYEYDHAGRKLKSYEKINGDSEVLLTENSYNEIGQLKSKGLGNGLQHTNYAYNERGWLKGSTSDQFSLQLQYQDGNTPQFNGNISGQLWGAGASTGNSFVYSYDKLNRLGSGNGPGMTESLSYDVMGNIESLTRDQLTRAYVYNGNQLTRTTGGPETGTYGYDFNGNAIVDGRSGKSFTYNELNLPATVSGGLSYVYDASGDKLKKSSSGTVTDYIDGIQYTNGAIELIQTEVGVARRNGASYSYEYNLSDHLGNVRYTFQKSPVSGQLERLQSDDYYPFGLRKSGNPVSLNNKYLYNGKELQDELGQYDYGARFYDPVIGRWNVVDPLAEQMRRYSPYTYVFNNPMRFIDPDGMKGQDWYQSSDNKTVKWFEGSGEQAGYVHKGEVAKIESSGQNSGIVNLNADGTATNASTGEIVNSSVSGNTQIIAKGAENKEAWYGNFTGPGPDADPHNLPDLKGGIRRPINEMDQGSQNHDVNYWLNGASGIGGALGNLNVAEADLQLAKTGFRLFTSGLAGQRDNVTNKRIIQNFGEMRWSLGIGVLFGGISTYKIPLSRIQGSYNGFINSMTTAWTNGSTIH